MTHMSDDSDADFKPLPWYGFDTSTDEQVFGPISDVAETVRLREAHPNRDHIRLDRHPTTPGS